jgi:hypothetical protein
VEGAVAIHALVGVRTEEVALALHEGSGQAVGAQAVVVGERRREGRGRDAGVERFLNGPDACAFRARRADDDVDERLASGHVCLLDNYCGSLNLVEATYVTQHLQAGVEAIVSRSRATCDCSMAWKTRLPI